MGPKPQNVEQARAWLARANSVTVLTGAGVSAESGVPTFRGDQGLWKQFRPEDLATPEAFARDPGLVWEWYEWRREAIEKAQPNPAHLAIAELERRKARFTLVTQNVDGLHDLAGSDRILKLHGDIWRLRCTTCGREWTDRQVPLPELPPHCACGGIARPAIVWFGEPLPEGIMFDAERATRDADVFLSVGTSAVVFPAASLIPLARRARARIVEINPAWTQLSQVADICLTGPAGEILPALMTA